MQDEQPQTEQLAAHQPQPKKQTQQQNPPDWAAFRKAFATLENKVTHIDKVLVSLESKVQALDSKVHLLACTVQENATAHTEVLTELAKSVHDHTKSRGGDTEATVKALAEQTAAIQQTLEATQHLLRCIAADPRAVPQLRKAAGQLVTPTQAATGLHPGLATLIVAIVCFGVTVALWAGLR